VLNPLFLKNLSIIGCPSLIELGTFIPESEGKGSFRSKFEVLPVSDISYLKLPSIRGCSVFTANTWICLVSRNSDFFMDVIKSCPKTSNHLPGLCLDIVLSFSHYHQICTAFHPFGKLEIFNCPAVKLLPQNGLPVSLTSYSNSGCNPTQYKMHFSTR
jgi:hypothetical protein